MRQRGFGWIEVIIGLAVLAIIVAAVAGIYHKGYAAGEAEVKLAWEAANRAQREKEAQQASEAATKLEANRGKAKVVYRTITEQVNVEVEKPVYRDICLPADGLRDANAALVGALTPAAKPDGGVPAADAAGGWNRGIRAPKDR